MSQSILFEALAAKTFIDAPFTVVATASSLLPVSFAIVSGPATVLGNFVTITGVGTVVVRASQPGNATFSAAPSVDRSFVVSKADQAINFAPLAPKTFVDVPFTVSAGASSTLPISFSIVSGPATINTSTNIITITGVGTVVVRAAQAGNANFNPAPNVEQSFIINKADQTISFSPLGAKTFVDAPFTVSAGASSTLPVNFSIVSGPATINTGTNRITITGVGTVVVRASQAGNANFNAAPNVDRSFAVAKADQAINFTALTSKTTADAPFTVTASASSTLPISFSVVSGPATINTATSTITITGIGAVVVRAAQPGNANFNAALSVDQSFTVTSAGTTPQTITFDQIAPKTFGNAPFNLTATASSLLPVTFTVLSGPATLNGNAVTLSGAGAVVIRASQLGDATFAPAANVDQTMVVSKAEQTIAFSPLGGKTFGDPPFTLSATATSTLPVSFSIVSGPATISINTITLSGTGTVTVRASQAGNTNYNVAPNMDQSFLVASASPPPPPPSPPSPPPFIPPSGTPIAVAPVIITQPANLTVVAPAAASFTIGATGTPLSFQWRKDGANISGANGSTFGLITTTPADAGVYSVLVFNAAGTIASSGATLTIEIAPSIAIQPAGQTVVAGSNVSFSVSAEGAPFPTFQWRKNGESIPGQVNATLNLTGVSLEAAGSYSVVVTNTHGSVTSTGAVLLVNRVEVAGSYFGTFPDGGSWALHARADNTATYLAFLPGSSTAVLAELTIAPDGTFSVSGSTLAAAPAVARSLNRPVPPISAASAPFTLNGRIANGQVTGQLSSQPLSGTVDQGTNTAAGFYRAPALLTAIGTTYSIVGPSGKAMVVTATSTAVDGATGTVGINNQLNMATAMGGQVALTLIPESKSVRTSYTAAGSSTPVNFSGLLDTVRATSALANLSIRSSAGTGAETLIVGFSVGGANKPILIRGIGPGLGAFGVTGTLGDPKLDLHQTGIAAPVGTNDNWPAAAANAFAQVGAFALTAGSRDAAILTTLSASSYTAQITDAGNATGIALVELYDTAADNGSRLVNVSARAQVGTGSAILITGFSVSGLGPRTLLIRAIGPTLAAFDVGGALADPKLDLFAGNSMDPVASNDNWESSATTTFAKVGAFHITPGTRDAVLVVTLNPGTYTAQVSGVGNTTGVALVEVYEVR